MFLQPKLNKDSFIPEFVSGFRLWRIVGLLHPTVCGRRRYVYLALEGRPDVDELVATYADITALMTYPSLFMGIGNFVAIPFALAVGRRPIFLISTVVLIIGACLCAYAKDYNTHLGLRMFLGLAAGQSEALAPMMVQVSIELLYNRLRCRV